jgi:lipoprotein signal peptidase
VADMGICIGAASLIVSFYRRRERHVSDHL